LGGGPSIITSNILHSVGRKNDRVRGKSVRKKGGGIKHDPKKCRLVKKLTTALSL